jgi:hypothetical protein
MISRWLLNHMASNEWASRWICGASSTRFRRSSCALVFASADLLPENPKLPEPRYATELKRFPVSLSLDSLSFFIRINRLPGS